MRENDNIIPFTKTSIGLKAIYSSQVIKEYGGNPLIEVLPPIISTEQAIEQLSVFPEFDEGESQLDEYYRFHCIQRLFRYFQPFDKHLDLEQKISRTIRQGYLTRNPLSRNHAELMQQSYESLKRGELLTEFKTENHKTATGFTIIGLSGIGKTTGIERVLSLYPQILVHSKYEDQHLNLVQLTWLKLDCPFDGSLKGLCTNFFAEVDRLLGSNYFIKYKARNNTVDTLLQHMSHIANLHGIGVLIIDEIQHLSMAKSGGSDKMLNFFVTLVNTIGIPVVLIGTNKAISVLQSEFRQARRGSGQGDMVWGQMPKDDMWDLFIEGMWEYQWLKKYTALTPEMNELLYEESQGILDIAVKIFMIAQLRAISIGKEKITEQLIKQVANDSLKLVQPMIKALKSGIPSEIARYEDLRPIDIEEYFEKYQASVDLKEKIRLQKRTEAVKRSKKESSIIEEVVLHMLQLDIDAKTAKQCVEQVLSEYGYEIELPFAKKEAIKLAFNSESEKPKKQSKTSKKKREPIFLSSDDLRVIMEDSKKKKLSVYDVLVKNEIIKDPLGEFLEEFIV